MDDLARVLAWLRAVARDRAVSAIPVPGGEAFLHPDFPLAHDHNRLLISGPCGAPALHEAADAVLGGAGLAHRLIDVQSLEVADAVTAGLLGYGYERSEDLIMRHAGGPRQPRPLPGPVVELALPERAAVAEAEWRRDKPDGAPDLARQLGWRILTMPTAAHTTFLAVRDEDTGAVLAHADLYVRDGIAQIEEVMTDPAHQNRGLASAVVNAAVQRAAAADLLFLIADGEDWPQQWYRTLGFADLGRTASFATPS